MMSLRNADFMALDLELSGLGSNLKSCKNAVERYKALYEAARTRSILSLGLAFFEKSAQSGSMRCLEFTCQVFNILCFCNEPFVVEPEALEFLVEYSFDFNRLINMGVPYYPSTTLKVCPLKSLITEILSHSIPLFLHNGLVDLVFLYHHFYSPLPECFGEFCNALSDLYTPDSPICDTKYLAEYQTRMSGSFLEYVFRRCQRDNVCEAMASRIHLKIVFNKFLPTMVQMHDACEIIDCPLPDNFPYHLRPYDIRENICKNYSNHGFCRKQAKGQCSLLHNVDFAIELENDRRERNRKIRRRRFDHLKPDNLLKKERLQENSNPRESISVRDIENKPRITITGCHRAGVDAFMTGYAGLFQSRAKLYRDGRLDLQHVNRVPLSGKAEPLIIQRSKFTRNCKEHEKRFVAIQAERDRNNVVKTQTV
ncbi:CAF1 family ribonuclease [Dictyocaulus viviparus]|uniref:CAF1 family ribonuclease n=1 Tax=Dictyocaulus viviparus TaxID=29172 RepID=A0A0D8XAQ9_DICVI|nr:CAF1 family ribonuclease [Dictyocaulus viviparus]